MNILAAILNWINTQLGSQIPLLPLKWRDLIDVALILVAVRYIYTFFVGTRTQLLLRGLAIFFAVWGLAVSLQLTGLSLLFRVLADVGLIAIVVLFQSELREALERIGRSGLFVNAPELRAETLDEIVEAVESMASRRVGALIVIEQRTGLGDYAERGTILDAKVTSDLLRTIFYPGTR
ncbi:MAG: DNA integrity scanning protein DisA nucleotide-binding domain protein, partial [Deinococcus sp.]|nr:DNA integrity scanning protein DisA nucleotide-binding domain protein [Deinococcus sp.]